MGITDKIKQIDDDLIRVFYQKDSVYHKKKLSVQDYIDNRLNRVRKETKADIRLLNSGVYKKGTVDEVDVYIVVWEEHGEVNTYKIEVLVGDYKIIR